MYERKDASAAAPEFVLTLERAAEERAIESDAAVATARSVRLNRTPGTSSRRRSHSNSTSVMSQPVGWISLSTISIDPRPLRTEPGVETELDRYRELLRRE